MLCALLRLQAQFAPLGRHAGFVPTVTSAHPRLLRCGAVWRDFQAIVNFTRAMNLFRAPFDTVRRRPREPARQMPAPRPRG